MTKAARAVKMAHNNSYSATCITIQKLSIQQHVLVTFHFGKPDGTCSLLSLMIFLGDPAHWTFMCISPGYSRVPTQDDRTTRDSFIISHLLSPYTHHLLALIVSICELSSLCYVYSVRLDHQSDSNLVISCTSYTMKTHKHNTL